MEADEKYNLQFHIVSFYTWRLGKLSERSLNTYYIYLTKA